MKDTNKDMRFLNLLKTTLLREKKKTYALFSIIIYLHASLKRINSAILMIIILLVRKLMTLMEKINAIGCISDHPIFYLTVITYKKSWVQ